MNRYFAWVAVAAGVMAQGWQDMAKHKAQLVTVAEGVRLEVLDWGGSGKPLVLLAGYFSAHVYDDFAPKLTGSFHVYAITRRGYGGSTKPQTGYSADQRAEDLKNALDALKLEKPILAGHSFGAEDMTTLSTKYPDRVSGLVYMNSAEDPTLGNADYGLKTVEAKRLPAAMRTPPRPDLASFAAYRTWQMKAQGIVFPESELRQIFTEKPDGTLAGGKNSADIRQDIFDGRKKPEYSKIQVPVLAFVATPAAMEDQVKKFSPATADERTAMEESITNNMAIQKRHRDDLVKGVPAAKVVNVPGANFYIFASHGDLLAKEIAAFASGK